MEAIFGCSLKPAGRRPKSLDPMGEARRSFFLACLLAGGLPCSLWAYSPLYIRQYMMPGKHALDLHSTYNSKLTNSPDSTFTQALNFGITKDFAFLTEFLLYRDKNVDLHELSVAASRRLYNNDDL